VASTGPHGKGVWVQADVTSLVQPGSTLSVVLQQSSSSASPYRSRESGATYAPQLVVTTVSEPADTQAPTAPAGLTATATSGRSVDLAWAESTDDVGVVGYEVYRDGARIATTGPVTSYADGTVAPGATYTYVVAALDAAGNRSSFSPPATVSLPASDTQPPSAPSNLVAIASSPVVVDLSWQPSTDDVGVAGYVVHRDGARRAEVGSTTTSYEDAASPATTYTYRVTAMDAAGNESMPSDPAEA
jgi:fibronectin type 3 domain-containing protein